MNLPNLDEARNRTNKIVLEKINNYDFDNKFQGKKYFLRTYGNKYFRRKRYSCFKHLCH